MGSNPVTPTKNRRLPSGDLLFLIADSGSHGLLQSRTNCEGPGIEYDRRRWRMKGVRNGAAVKIGSEVTSVRRFWAPQEVAMGSNLVIPTTRKALYSLTFKESGLFFFCSFFNHLTEHLTIFLLIPIQMFIHPIFIFY